MKKHKDSLKEEMQLTAVIRNDKIFFPYQNEIENFALISIGTCDNIYFDKIILTSSFSVKFSKRENAWELIEEL